MRKLIIICLLFFIMACSPKVETEDLTGVNNMNEVFIYNGFEVKVTNAIFNDLEVPNQKDEVVIYIYIEYPLDETILSKDCKLHTMDKKVYSFYSVDGLDYLGGSQRAEDAFIRFSVPKNITKFVLYLNDIQRVLIELGE